MKAVGLIMAAGLSQRMGQFKPLLPIGGKPMIERTLSTCLQANIRENFVVVGHCAHLVVQALRHMDVRFLYNAAYQTADMLSSVQLGLDHIATQTDADAAFPEHRMYAMRFAEDYLDYSEDYLESLGLIEWE